MLAGRRDPLTTIGLLMLTAGLSLTLLYRIQTPTTHFFGGLFMGLGVTLLLAGWRRGSRQVTKNQ